VLGAKSTSKKEASVKPSVGGDDPWSGNTNAKNEPEKSGSKNDDTWGATGWDTGDGKSLDNAWDKPAGVSGGDDKKDDPGTAWDTTPSAPAAAETCDNPAPGGEDGKNDEKKDVKEDVDSDGWTKEQDEKLIQMKTENIKSWAEIGEEIGGKTKQDCIDRFKKIKPDDWKPNDGNKGGGGKGGEGKKGKNKEKKQSHDQNQGKGGNKQEEKKDSQTEDKKEKSNPSDSWGAWGVGGFMEDTTDDKKDDTDKANDTKNSGSNDVADTWGKKVEEGATTGVDAATTSWDTINQPNANNGSGISQGFDNLAWGTTIEPNKPPSISRSQHKASNNNNNNSNTQPITARPLEFEVKPDDTFSADDLRLVARILQQDCAMVWNRVSWRFRDKTGRTLHPDEFEKKITGRLEGKDGGKGERRR
jgi:hypothetical protein